MPDIAMTSVKSAAELLKALLKKIDNGDGVLTESKIYSATNGRYYKRPLGRDGKPLKITGKDGKPRLAPKPTIDAVTIDALLAAVRRGKSAADRSTAFIVKGVGEALAEAVAANASGAATLTTAEQAKVKSKAGKTLIAFARVHAGDAVSDFALRGADEAIYVPKTLFKATSGATPDEVVEQLMTHFNAFSNDNRASPGPQGITRYVLGPVEAKGVVGAIGEMKAPFAKQVLKALEKRIQMQDDRGAGFKPRRIWVDKKGVPLLDALAKKLGVKANFVGNPQAPKYDYY